MDNGNQEKDALKENVGVVEKKQKKSGVLIIVLFLIILGLVGYIIYNNYLNLENEKENNDKNGSQNGGTSEQVEYKKLLTGTKIKESSDDDPCYHPDEKEGFM